jgi:hypothetical protein
VSNRTRRVPVRFQYASESDGHYYPIPRHVAIEGGAPSNGDRHVILLDGRFGGDLQSALGPPATATGTMTRCTSWAG